MKSNILKQNELAIDKWGNAPKFSPGSRFSLSDKVRVIYETKRLYIIRSISKYLKQHPGKVIKVIDFGSGHGGLAIDIKKVFGKKIEMYGYEVSPKAFEIALSHKKSHNQLVHFHLDEECNITEYFKEKKFDIIISTDVFGHVPDLSVAFKGLYEVLIPGGEVHAFSESVTSSFLMVATHLKNKGIELDSSSEEHISLFPKEELESLLKEAGFSKTVSYGFDPIRFAFYPDRYLQYLKEVKSPYYIPGLIFSLFSMGPLKKPAMIVFSFINYLLALSLGRFVNTAGCFVSAYKA